MLPPAMSGPQMDGEAVSRSRRVYLKSLVGTFLHRGCPVADPAPGE
jgi:hypothetical protein